MEFNSTMNKCQIGLMFVITSLFCSAFASQQESILGVWLTTKQDAKVEIFHCGDRYCGKLVWLKKPTYPANDKSGMAGKVRIDKNNPNPALQERSIIGMQVMDSFKYANNNQWQDGNVYDPKNGKTYSCKLTLSAENQLEVRGFIGISLFGRTEVWTRSNL
jgi:uncharacterized protein (DUF2147 family)